MSLSSAVSAASSVSAFGSNQSVLSSSAANLSSFSRKLSGYFSSFSFLTVTSVITLPVRFLNFRLKTPSASLSVSGFLPIVFSSSVSLESPVSSALASVAVSVSAAITAWPANRLVPIAAVIKIVTFFLIYFKVPFCPYLTAYPV